MGTRRLVQRQSVRLIARRAVARRTPRLTEVADHDFTHGKLTGGNPVNLDVHWDR